MRTVIEVDRREYDRMIKFFPTSGRREMNDALDHIGRHFLKHFFAKRLAGPPGVKARPHGLKKRFFREKIQSATIQGMGIKIYSDSEVARIHETGGLVRSKSGGRLAVPLSFQREMFTKSGRLKKTYRNPRKIRNTFLKKIRGKTYVAKRPKEEGGELKPLFVLKGAVRMRARLGFFKEWDAQAAWRLDRIQKGIRKAFN